MGLILLIVLIILLLGAVPAWPYSRNWGIWTERWTRPAGSDRADPVVAQSVLSWDGSLPLRIQIVHALWHFQSRSEEGVLRSPCLRTGF